MPTNPGNADFDEKYDDPGRRGLQTRLRIWEKDDDFGGFLRVLVGSNNIETQVGFKLSRAEAEDLADFLDDWLEDLEEID